MAPGSRRMFVTGVGRGLGRTLAAELATRGHDVWGSTRTGDTDLALAGCVALELGTETGVRDGARALAERIDRLDVLVNCAGVDARAFGAADDARGPYDIEAGALNGVLAVNLMAPVLLTTALLPLLQRSEAGLVLNVSSQLGSLEVGADMGQDTAYNVSKAALNMWTRKAAAARDTTGVSVVALHPGWVRTDMGGARAALTAEESAAAIATVLEGLDGADNGRFLRWDGTDHPW